MTLHEDEDSTAWIAREAARLVVDSGLEYDAAKKKAAKTLGRRGAQPAQLPSSEAVEDEVREHLALFCADTQPAELATLRQLALTVMKRLTVFRPHLAGAVWRGTATRLSAIVIDLYCDDPKYVEIELLNQGVAYDVDSGPSGPSGATWDVLTLSLPCPAWHQRVPVHLVIHDFDDLRGALRPDSRGRSWRGDLARLQQTMGANNAQPLKEPTQPPTQEQRHEP
jgi:hypothetical protein